VTRRAHKGGSGLAARSGALDANALWPRASELARAEKIREAEKLLVKLAKLAPKNADIFGFHDMLKVQAGKYTQAVPLLTRALRLDEVILTLTAASQLLMRACLSRIKQNSITPAHLNLTRAWRRRA